MKRSGLVTESSVDQRGAYVLLGDVALLLGIVFLLLLVFLFQQLGQRLQGLGAPQRGPLGVAGVVLNEVNALAVHLDLEEERGRQQGSAQHTLTGTKQRGTHTRQRTAAVLQQDEHTLSPSHLRSQRDRQSYGHALTEETSARVSARNPWGATV